MFKSLREKLKLNRSDYGKLFGYLREYAYVYEKETEKRAVSSSDEQIMKYIEFLHNRGLLKEFCVINDMPEVAEKLEGKTISTMPVEVAEKFDDIISTVTDSFIQNTNEHFTDIKYILERIKGANKKQLEKMNLIYKKYNNYKF